LRDEGKFIIVHVNRLKRAKTGPEANRNMLEIKKLGLSRRNQSLKQSEPRLNEIIEEFREEEVEIPPIHIGEVNEYGDRNTDEESSEASPTTEDQQQPEWTPETRYLRRKIVHENNRSFESTSDSPYALPSKSTRTQFR
jgi:hypothetical protein